MLFTVDDSIGVMYTDVFLLRDCGKFSRIPGIVNTS